MMSPILFPPASMAVSAKLNHGECAFVFLVLFDRRTFGQIEAPGDEALILISVDDIDVIEIEIAAVRLAVAELRT